MKQTREIHQASIRDQRSLGLSAAAALAILLFLQPMLVSAQATELSQERLAEIKQGCGSAQISLQQLQKRDAVSRINRGRAYDQLVSQITAMNSRLAYNNVNLPELVAISKELQAHIDQFRFIADKQYLEHLVSAIKVNCKDKPAEFYTQLRQAREERDKVVSEVDSIDQLIATYRETLAKYQASLPEPTGATQ